MKKTILSTLLFALVVSLSFVSCKKKEKEKEPEPVTETNYINISGTKYGLKPSIDNDGTLTFAGTQEGGTMSYPYIIFDFGDNSLPSSTVTYNGTLKVIQSLAASGTYTVTSDFKIIVNNGEFSITVPSTILKNNNDNEITCFGNLTYKQ